MDKHSSSSLRDQVTLRCVHVVPPRSSGRLDPACPQWSHVLLPTCLPSQGFLGSPPTEDTPLQILVSVSASGESSLGQSCTGECQRDWVPAGERAVSVPKKQSLCSDLIPSCSGLPISLGIVCVPGWGLSQLPHHQPPHQAAGSLLCPPQGNGSQEARFQPGISVAPRGCSGLVL